MPIPTFVPGKPGVALLSSLAERGVRVRILTNSLASTDVAVVHAGYAKYRKRLLRAGVELYEVNKKLTRIETDYEGGPSGTSKASLHAKSFVLDREEVFVGSLNLDPRSLVENTELGIVITSPDMARVMAEQFDEILPNVAFRLQLQKDKDDGERIVWHGMTDGQEQVFTTDPYTSFGARFGVGIMSLFPIESQL